MIIVGAGMAGLLAANMLRKHSPVVVEAQSSLPNNHSAVLRFRTPVVGEVLGIPFRKVNVIKGVLPWLNDVADSLAYAKKNLGHYRSDRSINQEVRSSERWIAPPDLVERMADGLQIEYGRSWEYNEIGRKLHGKPISTIPMPTLMDLLEYPGPRPSFGYRSGLNIRARVVDCDAYVSLLVPDPRVPFSRVSITGDELIVEVPGATTDAPPPLDFCLNMALKCLGMEADSIEEVEVKDQRYAKIMPIDESIRRDFMFWASSVTQRTWFLGRYACWRPGLLLDDLVKDVRLIEKWMAEGSPAHATGWRSS